MVWVNTPTILYRMKMSDLTLEAAWYFEFRDDAGTVVTNQEMVDIALNSAGEMYGISRDPASTAAGTRFLYRVQIPQVVNTGVARADRVGQLNFSYNALTFTPPGMRGPTEELLAADNSVDWAETFMDVLDTTTAQTTYVGPFGGALKSSGDMVAVQGVGLFASVKDSGGAEWIVSVDPASGTATKLGTAPGSPDIWGLAYWNGSLLALTGNGLMVRVDPSTGAGTPVWDFSPASCYGAAVSPTVPLHVP